jgi:SAM-dependent methyltransferase
VSVLDRSRAVIREVRAGRLGKREAAEKALAAGSRMFRELQERRLGKRGAELAYWRRRHEDESTLSNDHYEYSYTRQFELTRADYAGKRVLDIGCGPRGSLEWATEAAERVGLDPLADDYRRFGTGRHKMTYVAAGSEAIPFPDGHFDIVTAFNSLDHVEDVDATIREMTRVTKDGGIGLVIVEVNHEPTATEPHELRWDVVNRFEGWRIVSETRAAVGDSHDVYKELRGSEPYTSGPGWLAVRLERLSAEAVGSGSRSRFRGPTKGAARKPGSTRT